MTLNPSIIDYNLGRLEQGSLYLPPYSESFNCASFVRLIADIPKSDGALSLQLTECVERPIQYARRGDIVFNNNFSHCGICLGYPYIAHYTKEGLQVESYIKCFSQGYAYGN